MKEIIEFSEQERSVLQNLYNIYNPESENEKIILLKSELNTPFIHSSGGDDMKGAELLANLELFYIESVQGI